MFFSNIFIKYTEFIFISIMNLEKLFWSKTKVDILKYLIFRRQWISMRALESEIWWTFPAIKKQIDSLEESWIIDIQKENSWFAISIKKEYSDLFKQIFFTALKSNLTSLFNTYSIMINKYFLGKLSVKRDFPIFCAWRLCFKFFGDIAQKMCRAARAISLKNFKLKF